MITDDERFIKIVDILALSDIHPNDCIKINDLIIDLSKQKDYLQNQVEKLTQENNDLEERANVLNHENIRLKQQLHQSSLDIQELTERDIFCPTSCEKLDKYKSVIDKAIEYIEHSWWLRTEVVYDTSKDLKDWEVKELLEILRSK